MMEVTIETIRKSLKNFQGGNISKGLGYLQQASYCLLATGTGVIAGGTARDDTPTAIINLSNHPERRQQEEEILNVDHVEEDQEGCCDDDAIKNKRRSGLRLTRGMDRYCHQRSYQYNHYRLSTTVEESQSESDTDDAVVTDIHVRPLPVVPTPCQQHSGREKLETMIPFAQSSSSTRLPHEEENQEEEKQEEEKEEKESEGQYVVESIIQLIKYLTNSTGTSPYTRHAETDTVAVTDNIFPFPINQPIIHQQQILSFLEVCFDQLINHQRLLDERLQCLFVELLGDVLVQLGRYSDAFQYFLFCIDTLERLLLSLSPVDVEASDHHLLPWSSIAERLQSLLYKVDCIDVLQFMTLFKSNTNKIDGEPKHDNDGFFDHQLYQFQRNSQVMTKFIRELEELGDFYFTLECNLARRMRVRSRIGKVTAIATKNGESGIEGQSEARFVVTDSKAIFCYEHIVKVLSRPNSCLEKALQIEIQSRICTKMDQLNALIMDVNRTEIPTNLAVQSGVNEESGHLLSRKYQPLREKLLSLLATYKQKYQPADAATTTEHSSPIQVSRDIIQRCKDLHTINQQWTNDIRILLRDIMSIIEDRIGPPPFDLKYCIVLLGSYGREEACPYSDLEVGVIYSNESHDQSFNQLILQYFTVFFRFFEMAIAWIARDCPFLQPMTNRHSTIDDPSLSSSSSKSSSSMHMTTMKMKKKKGFRLDPNHQPLSSHITSNSSPSFLFEVQELIAKLQGKDMDILTNDAVDNKKQRQMDSLILSSLFHSAMRLKGDIYFYEEFLYQLPLLYTDDLERFQRYVHHIDLILEDYLAKSLFIQKQHDQWLLSLSTSSSLTSSSSGSTAVTVKSHLVHAKTEYLFLFTLIDELCQRHQIVHNPNSESLHGGGGLIERLQALQEKELINASLAQGLQLVALFLLRLRFELHFFYEDDRDDFLSYDATLSYEYQYEQLIEDTSMNSFFVLRPDDNRLWSHYRSYLHTLLMKIHSCISEEDLMMNLHALDLRVIARFWLLRIDCELERLMEIQQLNPRGDDDDDCDSGHGISQFMRNTMIQQYFLLAERCNSKLTEDVTLGDYIQNYVLSKLSLMV